MTRTLTLPLKRRYFEQIRSGAKLEEYRLCTPYWQKRLEERSYDGIALTLGYPRAGDPERTLTRPWKGFRRTFIRHPLFGDAAVEVYAIDVSGDSQRARSRTIRIEPLPEGEHHPCPRCGGSGSVETVRDAHRSAGIIPCPAENCGRGVIRSRTVEIIGND